MNDTSNILDLTPEKIIDKFKESEFYKDNLSQEEEVKAFSEFMASVFRLTFDYWRELETKEAFCVPDDFNLTENIFTNFNMTVVNLSDGSHRVFHRITKSFITEHHHFLNHIKIIKSATEEILDKPESSDDTEKRVH